MRPWGCGRGGSDVSFNAERRLVVNTPRCDVAGGYHAATLRANPVPKNAVNPSFFNGQGQSVQTYIYSTTFECVDRPVNALLVVVAGMDVDAGNAVIAEHLQVPPVVLERQ